MKYKLPIFCILTTLVGALSVTAVDKVKLTIRKNIVVSVSDRDSVITAAEAYLTEKNAMDLAALDEISNPFFNEVAPVVAEVANTQTDVEQPAVVTEATKEVVYGDDSVLKVIGSNFAGQVRGTLARGNTSYIQLQGGNLIKAGAAFPARLPQDADKTYTVKLIEVTPDDYTLSLGSSTLTLQYSEASTSVRKDP